jgi:hypothetical protein
MPPASSSRYTDVMSSVARDLRAKTVARVLEMSTSDRIALALALGDDDLDQLVRASGLDRNEARRRLVQQRQRGRTPSRCTTATGR